MSNNQTLKIKENVEITCLDDYYVMSYMERNWKLSKVVYEILSEMDGRKSKEEILSEIHSKYPDTTAITMEKLNEFIQFMNNNKILERTDDEFIQSKKNSMLWGRITILSKRYVERLKFLEFLYHRNIMIVMVTAISLWVAAICFNNSSSEVVQRLYGMSFSDILICYGYIFAIGIFHEFGHSVALMKNNQKPGRIGVAVYFIMPVLFSDVTMVCRLKRKERIMVDIGGIYFQGLLSILLYIINHVFIHNAVIEIALIMTAIQIVGNFNPFIKFDGYWVLSDYFDTTDIHALVKTFFAALFKRKMADYKFTKKQICILFTYGTMFSVFMVYFIRMIFNAFYLAVVIFYNDLIYCFSRTIQFSFNHMVEYVSGRITSIIVVAFSIRLIVMFGKKVTRWIKKNKRACSENN